MAQDASLAYITAILLRRTMTFVVRTLWLLVFAVSAPCQAAADVTDMLTTVWESFWYETGYPRIIHKWREPIRVKFSGFAVERYKPLALRQLLAAADAAGVDLAEAGDGVIPNLEVELLLNGFAGNTACVTYLNARNGVIRAAKIQASDADIVRCMLHESMHVMGIPGHPLRNSVLTYFGRGNTLTEADKFMLKVIYSNDVEPGTYPLPALEIFARRIVETVPPSDRAEAERRAQAFLRNTIKQMEAFAAGPGNPPAAILRSSTFTSQGIARGRREVQFFLGVAYAHGQIVEADKHKSVAWLSKGAAASSRDAQFLLCVAYAQGEGIERDPVEGYKWCYLSANRGSLRARDALRDMEAQLQPEQITEGKARADAWQQTKS